MSTPVIQSTSASSYRQILTKASGAKGLCIGTRVLPLTPNVPVSTSWTELGD